MTAITLHPTVIVSIVPYLNTEETLALNRVCKSVREALKGAAKTPQKDVDFTTPNATWTPGAASALIAHQWKMEIFTRRPELLGKLGRVKEEIQKAKAKKDYLDSEVVMVEISFDYKKGKLKEDDLKNALSQAVNEDDTELLKTVLFHQGAEALSAYDFYSNADTAILRNNPAILRMILAFPGAAKIPAQGKFGLEALLIRAVNKNSI